MRRPPPRAFRCGLALHVHVEDREQPRHFALGEHDRQVLASLVDAMQVALDEPGSAALLAFHLVHHPDCYRAGRHAAPPAVEHRPPWWQLPGRGYWFYVQYLR